MLCFLNMNSIPVKYWANDHKTKTKIEKKKKSVNNEQFKVLGFLWLLAVGAQNPPMSIVVRYCRILYPLCSWVVG